MDPYQSARHLPADLFPEILCRLPVKSLLRFRCVSKPWLTLVDDAANFRRLHLNTLKNNREETRLFVVKHENYLECEVRCRNKFEPIPKILPPSETRKPGNWWPIFFIDGLILLKSTTCRFDQSYDLKLWNPSIAKSHEIPPLRPTTPSNTLWDIDIGLGYDSVAKDYKLVKLFFLDTDKLHSVAVHALGSASWNIINDFDWHWDVAGFNNAVYFQSKLHFIAMDQRQDGGLDLVWFDLSKQEFSSITILDDPCDFLGWNLVSLDDVGLTLQIYYESSFIIYKSDQLYYLNGHPFYLFQSNEHMLTFRAYMDKVLDKNGKVQFVITSDVGSYNRKREEYKMLEHESCVSHVSCYVESLILHKNSNIMDLEVSD